MSLPTAVDLIRFILSHPERVSAEEYARAERINRLYLKESVNVSRSEIPASPRPR